MRTFPKRSPLRLGARAKEPVGAIRVVDPSPLNWLYITYNTVEELVHVNPEGKIRPAAMRRYRWEDERTLKIDVRRGERFPDGEPLTAASVKRAFDEQGRWVAPHPPGTHFTWTSGRRARPTASTPCASACPSPTASCSESCAMHVMSTRFWEGSASVTLATAAAKATGE